MHRHPRSTLFPYTTLFRSSMSRVHVVRRVRGRTPARQRGRGGGRDPRPHRGDDQSLPRPKDRKSTRLNSSHVENSYAVFCLKKKKQKASPNKIKHAEAQPR